jgi:signal transduction histidine kinase
MPRRTRGAVLGRRVDVALPQRAVAGGAGEDERLAEPSPEAEDHARERLERADRLAAIGTLAAGIVHDIRNPLVSVRTFLQLLPERLDDEEFKTTFRELALSELDRVCLLINDLLSFSRPTACERELMDLTPIVGQMVRLLEPEARKGDVHLVLADGAAPVPVLADEAQIRQVLMNVVLNAIEATPAGGRVTVACTALTEGGGVITVTDTGAGLPGGEPAQIFEPFYTTKSLGSGLGLYVARRIVEDHDGTIEAARRDAGGTSIRIRLPDAAGSHGDR